mmetsp:Transcript_127684/g.408720  ORF Transcript_127684/g.408720 Transcript_127684/m.408720 type:complete len:589 (-) Transcript_127684:83-1849(-)
MPALRLTVAALGAGADEAEPFFEGPCLGELRNDWPGEVGVRFKVEQAFAVLSLGRFVAGAAAGQTLRQAVSVTLWGPAGHVAEAKAAADAGAVLAAVDVGPASCLKDNYAFEMLGAQVVLEAGKEYRLTQKCSPGMTDPWLDGQATLEQATAKSNTKFASFLGGAYNLFGGFPSFEDGDLCRFGMVNFEIAPIIASVSLEAEALSVRALKLRIEELTGLPPLQQQLVFGGAALSDGCSLAECGVRDGSYVQLAVQSAAFLATASDDGTARLWDVSEGHCLRTLEGHTAAARCVHFSPSCSHLVTGSSDGTARLWSVEDGTCLWILEGHAESIRSASFSPISPTILTASEDHTARLWDVESKCCRFTLSGHTGAVVFAAFSPNGQRVVTSSFDCTARLWVAERGISEGSYLLTFSGHRGSVVSASFTLDSSRVLTTSVDASEPVRMWSAEDGTCLCTFSKGTQVREAHLSPDGAQVISVDVDHRVRVWCAESGTCSLELQHGEQALAFAISLDGTLAATACGGGVARLWHMSDGKLLHTLLGHSGEVSVLAFHPDGTRLVQPRSVLGSSRSRHLPMEMPGFGTWSVGSA